MPTHDEVHFDDYTPQTRAKHQILGAYLPAYLKALKNTVDRFHYIDGFAGRGRYQSRYPGSPLLALDEIAGARLAACTSVSLIEENPTFFDELARSVAEHRVTPTLLDAPLLRCGTFAEHLPEILRRPIHRSRSRVATFAFVDPCGVAGVEMSNLVKILGLPFGEVLLFFNYDGVNRLLGGLDAGTNDDDALQRLFGTPAAVAALSDELRRVADREVTICSHFVAALRRSSTARFYVAFRIEAKASDRTSHYLLHCSDHHLGFRIMKSVMEGVGRTAGEEYGALEMLTDRDRGQLKLFRPDIEAQKAGILERLRDPCQVRQFTYDWVSRPEDMFSERAYKKMLLELEADGAIEVFDKEDRAPAPASRRRPRRGVATLGDDYWLHRP